MYGVLIIGCGITGAATAFELAKYRLRVGIVERENDVALGTTKANSAILHAPSAAICSPWEYCLALAETAVKNGAELRLNAAVTGLDKTADGWTVHTNQGDLQARFVLNAAGVDAAAVHDLAAPHSFDIRPARGQYYLLDKGEGDRVGRVIFQCPSKAGKGVLVAPTVHGNLIVGPDSQPVAGNDTATTGDGLGFVRETAQKSVPSINFRESIRNFAGVRAAADRPDFILEEAAPGFVDLAGICSPGLSAAPAIGEYAVELLAKAGLALEKKDAFLCERHRTRFKELSPEERAALVERDPAFGRVICRCETVTEGEILEALHGPIPPVSVDGVKRRVNAGMGRCQGGFCGPRVVDILARELGKTPGEIVQDQAGSWLLDRETKAAASPPQGEKQFPPEGGMSHV